MRRDEAIIGAMNSAGVARLEGGRRANHERPNSGASRLSSHNASPARVCGGSSNLVLCVEFEDSFVGGVASLNTTLSTR